MTFEIGGMPLYTPGIKSRAITMENPTGEAGMGGKADEGRKGAPCHAPFAKDQTFTLADIEGPGCIRHIWITVQNTGPTRMRNIILRFYWDDQETPSVEAPLSDFFGVSHGLTRQIDTDYIVTPEGKGFNCYFPMPFAKRARLTATNETDGSIEMFFFQVDYTIGDPVDADTPLFHAQFRRAPRTEMMKDYVILDEVHGRGRYMGAVIGIVDHVENRRIWWGEGEVKIYLDGDTHHPTICGTGSEDYCGTGWGLGEYACRDLGAPVSNERYASIYRFHAKDPVYFSSDIRVTIQQIGNDGTMEPADPHGPLAGFMLTGRYLKRGPGGNFERVDDVCSTAYWYQTFPTHTFPKFPDAELRSLDLPPKN